MDIKPMIFWLYSLYNIYVFIFLRKLIPAIYLYLYMNWFRYIFWLFFWSTWLRYNWYKSWFYRTKEISPASETFLAGSHHPNPVSKSPPQHHQAIQRTSCQGGIWLASWRSGHLLGKRSKEATVRPCTWVEGGAPWEYEETPVSCGQPDSQVRSSVDHFSHKVHHGVNVTHLSLTMDTIVIKLSDFWWNGITYYWMVTKST